MAATQEAEFAQASRSLWLATLSLMTAFMSTQAPAHRLLLARRIATNFDELRCHACYSPRDRAVFARLCARWAEKARRFSRP